jgi:FkbM family methyltransferase
MTARSCSQYFQDVFVAEILMRGRPGIFVDVGARDGRIISNTYLLETRYGWSGMVIEPHPDLYAQTAQRRCVRINAAISDSEEPSLKFVKLKEEPFGNSGLLATYPHRQHLANKRHEIIDVKVLRLADVLREHAITHIDYLDIDVEGHELNVLRSLDFAGVEIRYLGVECPTSFEHPATSAIVALLEAAGYRHFARMGSDLFFSPLTSPLYQLPASQ